MSEIITAIVDSESLIQFGISYLAGILVDVNVCFAVGILVGVIIGVLVGRAGDKVIMADWVGVNCSFTDGETGEQETKNITQKSIESLFIKPN